MEPKVSHADSRRSHGIEMREWSLPRYRLFRYHVVVPENRFRGDVVIKSVSVIMSAILMIAVVIVNYGKGYELRRQIPVRILIIGVDVDRWKRWEENKEMLYRYQLGPSHLGYARL